MNKFLAGIILLGLLIANPAPADEGVTPMLKMNTAYYFMGGELIFRDTSWLLAWEGTIQGDVNGVIRWWIDTTETAFPIYVGRWELLDCQPPGVPIDCRLDALVIMAGYSAGTNLLPPVDGFVEWSGKGVVTFVGAEYTQYAKWFGRRTTEGGWYSLDEGGNPTDGVGPFMIYDRPSNKH